MLMSLAVIIGAIFLLIAMIGAIFGIITLFVTIIKDTLTGNTDSWGGGLFGPF